MDKLIVVNRTEKDKNHSYKLGWLIGTIKETLHSGELNEPEFKALFKNLMMIMEDDVAAQKLAEIAKEKGYEVYY